MAKRTVGLVAALVILWTSPAGAETLPQWPCEVTVSIEAGPWREAALGALRQLDEATVISWTLVEGSAMVTVEWTDPAGPATGLASWWVTDGRMVGASIDFAPGTEPRWVMTGLLHEFGHVAGLDHNDEERSMMNAQVPWRSYQRVDLEALAAVECR